ncbi:MAG: hypothetical protein WCT42_03295 [Candidatus Paceibacterota bacterium]
MIGLEKKLQYHKVRHKNYQKYQEYQSLKIIQLLIGDCDFKRLEKLEEKINFLNMEVLGAMKDIEKKSGRSGGTQLVNLRKIRQILKLL